MFQNTHTDQMDFSKLMFYKFFFSLASIGNFPIFNNWDYYAKLNCPASGRSCCNIVKDTSRKAHRRSKCTLGKNFKTMSEEDESEVKTDAHQGGGSTTEQVIYLRQNLLTKINADINTFNTKFNTKFNLKNKTTKLQKLKQPTTVSQPTIEDQLQQIKKQIDTILEGKENITEDQSEKVAHLRQSISLGEQSLGLNILPEEHKKLNTLDEYNNEIERILAKEKENKPLTAYEHHLLDEHYEKNRVLNNTEESPKTASETASEEALKAEPKTVIERAKAKAEAEAKEAHDFMRASSETKRQSKMYSKRSGKISGAAFQEAQAMAENLPYLENTIDIPASPSADSMTFDAYPYKPRYTLPSYYTETLDRPLMRHQPLFLETVNEIYDTMDTTTMTFLNKLFTNAIPYINRIKLYFLIAEMFPALAIEMEAVATELKLDPTSAPMYNKKIDENLRHLLYKYRKQVVKKRTENEIAWKKRKARIKNAIKKGTGLNKSSDTKSTS